MDFSCRGAGVLDHIEQQLPCSTSTTPHDRVPSMNGQLWLIGTPIGNLGDMTFRAVECLKVAGRIYAEDTRRTRTLLTHFGIEGKSLSSLHAHSTERDLRAALEAMSNGENIALVTDAGMPTISDPGTEMVRAARAAGFVVQVIPGPSAVTTAVALSGFVDGPFTFIGFLPRKGSKRKRMLEVIGQSPIPVVLFESPHRVLDTLHDLIPCCGSERAVAICRELTKKFEETRIVTLGESQAPGFMEHPQGEFSLVVDRCSANPDSETELDVAERAIELLKQGQSVRDVSAQLLSELSRTGTKTSKREIYALVQQLYDSAQQLDGSAQQLDGAAQQLDGAAQQLDGAAQQLDGAAQQLPELPEAD
jgi:16S rRNA (cytidine1402-2'-O)-methyltransferase